jgi:uncharacterized protein YcfL
MRNRITVIAVLTGLLVTGCSSEQSVTVENQAKLIEYEKCLLLQQEGLNIVNNQIARDQTFSELIEVLDRQAKSTGIDRFNIHLKNCETYRP